VIRRREGEKRKLKKRGRKRGEKKEDEKEEEEEEEEKEGGAERLGLREKWKRRRSTKSHQ
jgi:hypothetical protein